MKAIKEISLNGEKYQIFDKSAHDKIDNLQVPDIDLSDYATKEEVEAIPEIKVVTLENAPNDETDKNVYFICEDDIPEGSFFFKVICGTDTLEYKINRITTKTANVVPFEKCYVIENTKLTELYPFVGYYVNYKNNKNLIYFDFGNLDTSAVTRMHCMFLNCDVLQYVDFRNIDTSTVTLMSKMFCGCSVLNSIKGLSNLNTSNVTDMSDMFNGCSSLTSLDLSNFDTSKVTDMQNMFNGCSSLTSLDLSNFDTSNVKNMNKMFYNCLFLNSIDLSNFDTSNVTNMENMFYYCQSLFSPDLSNFDTSKVTSMGGMFYGCSRFTSLDLSNFDTSKVTNMTNMFNGCSRLTSLDLSNFDTSKVTSMSSMFGASYSKLNNLNHIKCKQAFKDWCETNKTTTGISYIWDNITWEIVDAETEE